MNIYSFQVDASQRTTYEPYRGLLPIRYPLMLRDMRGSEQRAIPRADAVGATRALLEGQ